MRNVSLLVLAIGLIATAGIARAGMATMDVNWSLPTVYVDNTAISPTDQATIVTTVYFGTAAAGPWTQIGTSASGATSLTGLSVNMKRGDTYFTLTGRLNSVTSSYSLVTPFTYPAAGPNKPGNPRIIFK